MGESKQLQLCSEQAKQERCDSPWLFTMSITKCVLHLVANSPVWKEAWKYKSLLTIH